MWILVLVGIIVGAVLAWLYVYVIKDWLEYREAKNEIFTFVKSYRRLCTGNNRFIVTTETLQDSFRKYNIELITKVWLDLVNEHVIEQDQQDKEWCIR
jgi:hypothetical protein